MDRTAAVAGDRAAAAAGRPARPGRRTLRPAGRRDDPGGVGRTSETVPFDADVIGKVVGIHENQPLNTPRFENIVQAAIATRRIQNKYFKAPHTCITTLLLMANTSLKAKGQKRFQ